jgi:single-strand DNA-binding protein
LASHIGGSLSKGMRVLVMGELVQRSYQTREGEQRTVVELRVQEIGTALSRTATTPTDTDIRQSSPVANPFNQEDPDADEF